MRTAERDYEGYNMGARLMDDARESTRDFKQGYVPEERATAPARAPRSAPAPEHPVVTSYREWRADFIARRKG